MRPDPLSSLRRHWWATPATIRFPLAGGLVILTLAGLIGALPDDALEATPAPPPRTPSTPAPTPVELPPVESPPPSDPPPESQPPPPPQPRPAPSRLPATTPPDTPEPVISSIPFFPPPTEVVHSGAPCNRPGATARTPSGQQAWCMPGRKGEMAWRTNG